MAQRRWVQNAALHGRALQIGRDHLRAQVEAWIQITAHKEWPEVIPGCRSRVASFWLHHVEQALHADGVLMLKLVQVVAGEHVAVALVTSLIVRLVTSKHVFKGLVHHVV